jgi:hypothetical protein
MLISCKFLFMFVISYFIKLNPAYLVTKKTMFKIIMVAFGRGDCQTVITIVGSFDCCG